MGASGRILRTSARNDEMTAGESDLARTTRVS